MSAVPIIDPVYTGTLLLALVFGYTCHRRVWACVTVASIALTLSSGYLFYGLAQNDKAYKYAKNQLAEEGYPQADIRVYTTLFQIYLRRVVVHLPDEVRVGFITTWAPEKISWHKKPEAPLYVRQAILSHPHGKIYQWFTSGELIFCPHRSGDVTQWDMLDSRFGLPGDSVWGLWGRTVTLDAHSIVGKHFRNFSAPRDKILPTFSYLWKASFGKVALANEINSTSKLPNAGQLPKE